MLAFDTIVIFVIITSPLAGLSFIQSLSPFSHHLQRRRKCPQLSALLLPRVGDRDIASDCGAFRSLRGDWERTLGWGAKTGQVGQPWDWGEVGGLAKDGGAGSH